MDKKLKKLKYLILLLSCLGISDSTSIFAKVGPAKKRIANIKSIASTDKSQTFLTHKKNEIKVINFPALDKQNNAIKAKYHFYIQGGLHGNEILTSKFVFWLSRRLRNNKGPLSSFEKNLVAFDLVPIANPDGVSGKTRNNNKGVNLNRNFSYLWGLSRENPGSTSFSEPETKSIRHLFTQNNYTAAVDVHGYINWIVAPSKPNSAQAAAHPKPASRYTEWTTALKKQTQLFDSTYKFKTASELGDGGAFEDWAFWEQGSLAFCLEMASSFRYGFDYDQKTKKNTQQDLFIKYEKFIYNMFRHAIKISTENKLVAKN